jgi:hypothetical protein
MMSGLIPGPQSPRNDIDTYFRPLVEDLKELWYNDELHVWDDHKRENIGLKAILFATVSDSLASCNFGHELADLKKMRIMLELWLDDSVKATELPTSCITLSRHEKEFCGFLKNVKYHPTTRRTSQGLFHF